MQGNIKYIDTKNKYGRIITDSKEEFKFDFTDFNVMDINSLNSGDLIEFEQRNKRAKNCKIIKHKNNKNEYKISNNREERYTEPNDVYWSQDSQVNGWETLEVSDWKITASGRGNPNQVKETLKSNAKFLGANAIVNIGYYTSTGSESGTGNGTHYYTIHNYHGIPVNIGKKNSYGQLKENICKDINGTAVDYKKECDENYSKSWMIAIFLTIILAIFSLINYNTNIENRIIWGIGEVIVLFFILRFPTDHGWWLEKYK